MTRPAMLSSKRPSLARRALALAAAGLHLLLLAGPAGATGSGAVARENAALFEEIGHALRGARVGKMHDEVLIRILERDLPVSAPIDHAELQLIFDTALIEGAQHFRDAFEGLGFDTQTQRGLELLAAQHVIDEIDRLLLDSGALYLLYGGAEADGLPDPVLLRPWPEAASSSGGITRR